MLAHAEYMACTFLLGFTVCLKCEFQLLSISKYSGMSCYVKLAINFARNDLYLFVDYILAGTHFFHNCTVFAQKKNGLCFFPNLNKKGSQEPEPSWNLAQAPIKASYGHIWCICKFGASSWCAIWATLTLYYRLPLHASYFDVLYLTQEAESCLQTLTLPQEHACQHVAAMKMKRHRCVSPVTPPVLCQADERMSLCLLHRAITGKQSFPLLQRQQQCT